MDGRVDRAAIAAKRAHVQEQIDSLRAGDKIVKRIGGATILSTAQNVEVQQARLDHLDWLLTATEEEIRGHLDETSGKIGAGLVEEDGVIGRDFAVGTLLAKGLAELSQIALGEHRAQKADARRARIDADATGADAADGEAVPL